MQWLLSSLQIPWWLLLKGEAILQGRSSTWAKQLCFGNQHPAWIYISLEEKTAVSFKAHLAIWGEWSWGPQVKHCYFHHRLSLLISDSCYLLTFADCKDPLRHKRWCQKGCKYRQSFVQWQSRHYAYVGYIIGNKVICVIGKGLKHWYLEPQIWDLQIQKYACTQ